MSTYSYDFDKIIDRRNTNCGKWDTIAKKYGRNDLIHLGVADMDFMSPKPILDAFSQVVNHGVFGYTDLNDSFYTSIQRWIKKHNGINIPREWIIFCSRINIAAGICINTFTNPNDKVIINTPAYSPLRNAIIKNNRTVVDSPLIFKNDRYCIDFKQLESVVDENTKMLILCNPHNPTCRVWSKEELEQLVIFCLRHHIYLFVDEIHANLSSKNITHTSMLEIKGDIQNYLICANSITKTFNVPGTIISYMIIPNKEIRDKIAADIDRIGIHNPNIFSVVAVEAGYNYCDDWLEEACSYIDDNEKMFRSYISEHMPKFKVMPREGTYLLWINYENLDVTEKQLEKWFIEEANVEVYMGSAFGKDGEGFFRINLATSRLLLTKALNRMKNAYCNLKSN
ncbi:pyridoxal phosphate-dependent aminotransferase [Clostridium sediminicola]|uniref:MalY/PatB family protein n=1 Tax=Clostridium sediminicola TaxID=3114879 RepID=UPI0031F25C1E